MSIFGGIGPTNLLATAALGPGGGIAAQLGTQLYASIAQQVIQNFGQQLGLPQSAIDLAQGDFSFKAGDLAGGLQKTHDAVENLGREFNASSRDIGEAQRKTDEKVEKLNEQMARLIAEQAESDEQKEAKSGGGGGVGWLRAMARALGEKLDAAAEEMQELAGKVDKEDPSTGTEFTVASQEFNMLMNAVSTSLKTIGEAMGKMSARQ